MELNNVNDQQEHIFDDIRAERQRQDQKWGNQYHHPDTMWSLIFGEEVGEVHKAILENNYSELRLELIQVAAVAVQWLESLDNREIKAIKM